MLAPGRVCLAALTRSNIDFVAKTIAEVVKDKSLGQKMFINIIDIQVITK